MWIKNWWNDDDTEWKSPIIRIFTVLILPFILLGFIYSTCSTEEQDRLSDKKVFDFFIGLKCEEIINVFGNNGNNVTYKNSDEYATLIYNRDHFNQNNCYVKIIKSTTEIIVFKYYKQVQFLINEEGRCYDWRTTE